MKKFLISVLSLLTLLCVCLAAACGGQTSTVELVDFKDVTVEAEIGSVVSLQPYLVVADKDGKTYHTSVSIKTKDGKAVETLMYEFNADDHDGYIVSVSLKIDDKYYARTVTINMKDTSSPTIVIADLPDFGTTGEEYKVKYTVKDANQTSSELKITFVNADGSETPVEHVDGKFTPSKPGEYKLTVTATDNKGNPSATRSKTFVVREVLADYSLEEFSDKFSVDNATNYLNNLSSDKPVYKDELDGRYGVVGQTSQSGYHDFSFRFNRSLSWLNGIDASSWDYVSIWIYIDDEGEYNLYTWNAKYDATVIGKRWTEVKLTKSMITEQRSLYAQHGGTVEAFNKLHSSENKGFKMFWIHRLDLRQDDPERVLDNVYVYVDSIRFGRDIATSLEKTEYVLGDTVKLSATADGVGEAKFSYEVVDADGKVTAIEGDEFIPTKPGEYTVRATLLGNAYGVAETKITVRNNVEISAKKHTEILVNDTVVIPQGVVIDVRSGAKLDGVVSLKVVDAAGEEVTLGIDGALKSTNVGDSYTVTYTAEANGEALELSYTAVTVRNYARSINEFSDASTVTGIVPKTDNDKSTTDPEWLAEFEGRTGVVKAHVPKNDSIYQNFCVQGETDSVTLREYMLEHDAEWDYISAWVYINIEGEVNCIINRANVKVRGKTWYEVKITKEDILNNDKSLYKKCDNDDNPYCNVANIFSTTKVKEYLICIVDNTHSDNVIYIDSIRLEKNA